MPKDIYKDNKVKRYLVKCQYCGWEVPVYEIFASIPEHPKPQGSNKPYEPCLGSKKSGIPIREIPAGTNL